MPPAISAVRASCIEFILAGLYATDRIFPISATRSDHLRDVIWRQENHAMKRLGRLLRRPRF